MKRVGGVPGAGLIRIAGNLFGEEFERVVVALFAQSAHEFHAHHLTVDLFGKIEQVNFEQQSAVCFHRRPGTETRHARQGVTAKAVDTNHEDSGKRWAFEGDPQVERGEADGASEFATVENMTGEREGPPEQVPGAIEVAGGERLAYGRA